MTDSIKDEGYVRDNMMAKVRRFGGRVPFVADAMAAYYCAFDPATPRHVKAAIIGALAYFIMPIDVIPDVLLGLGFTDDAGVFYAAWRMLRGHITDAHRAQADQALK